MKVIMNKFLISALLAVSSFSANAGIWGSIVSSDWETKSTKKYTLDVKGWDVRVYEWIPEDSKDVRCVFLAGTQNSTGVACYDVEGGK